MAHPVDRFAAHLAHLLNNSDGEFVELNAGSLYATLIETLTTRYADNLLYHGTYQTRMDAEEAATRYFDVTIDRRLWLNPGVAWTVAHALLLALARRGADWFDSSVDLARLPVASDTTATPMLPAAQRALWRHLAQADRSIESGNAAAKISQRDGALHLRLGESALPVPEQISLWQAIGASPARMAVLPAGEPFNTFCGVVIDGLRTANRPVQELLGLGLGLCPFDWLEALSINQVRSLRRFLKHLPEARRTDMEAWREAFATSPVSGFADAQALWASPIGGIVRGQRTIASHSSIDDHPDIPDESAGVVQPADTFAEHLAALVAAGVIADIERRLLESIYAGDSLSEAAEAVGLPPQADMATYAMDLLQRVERYAAD